MATGADAAAAAAAGAGAAVERVDATPRRPAAAKAAQKVAEVRDEAMSGTIAGAMAGVRAAARAEAARAAMNAPRPASTPNPAVMRVVPVHTGKAPMKPVTLPTWIFVRTPRVDRRRVISTARSGPMVNPVAAGVVVAAAAAVEAGKMLSMARAPARALPTRTARTKMVETRWIARTPVYHGAARKMHTPMSVPGAPARNSPRLQPPRSLPAKMICDQMKAMAMQAMQAKQRAQVIFRGPMVRVNAVMAVAAAAAVVVVAAGVTARPEVQVREVLEATANPRAKVSVKFPPVPVKTVRWSAPSAARRFFVNPGQ